MEGTVENVFKDFAARRAALIRALTTEVDEFYMRCDPSEVNLCLFGYPDEKWEVCPPEEKVPPEIPEPVLRINAARDKMDKKDWLEYIAAQSDAWLISIAVFFGEILHFDKRKRARLFQMVNGLPTISEVITGTEKKQTKTKQTKVKARRRRRRKSDCWAPKPRWQRKRKPKTLALPEKDENSKDEEEEGEGGAVDENPDEVCGACGDKKALPEKDEDGKEEEEEEEGGAVDENPDDVCGACGDKKGDDEFSI